MKILSTNINEFTHVVHMADIHVRLTKRHEEYIEIFDKVYENIDTYPASTIICVVGDVCHNKTDLSPECVQIVSELLRSLADYRPTILLPGNHDATLSNKSRLDSLTPIVDAIQHSNLFYLKNSGLYGLGNVLFNVMSIFDDPDKYIRGKDIPEIYRNQYNHIVALFHGPVDQACTDLGYRISNPAIMTPLFDWNDMALLGDIHKMQDMQDYKPDEHKPIVRYCGSLIQQNHGESLTGHGYSLWDLKKRSYKHIEIPNDYGYYTIEVNNGKLCTDIKDIPKKARLRVKCFETIASEVKSIISKIKSTTDVTELSYVRVKSDKDIIAPVCKNIILNDITNVDYQGKLIEDFLKSKFNTIPQSSIDQIILINKETNSSIKKDEFSRSLKWKPKKFEWDNMFTYGEGNIVDFTKLDGVIGLFASNTSGKSSLLSALMFCLFDKWDRGFKGENALNAEKSSFRCKINFEINNVDYFIEKIGTTTRTGSVKVDVKFWKEESGIETSLNSTDRRKTNDIIREYIGSYEDFILTTMSIQNGKNNISFIDLGNTERKDLLVQFIGLNIFDRLHEVADKKSKEINTVLKLHRDKNYSQDLIDAQNNLSQSKSTFKVEEQSFNELQEQKNEVNEKIVEETKKLIKLDSNVPSNLKDIENRKIQVDKDIQNLNRDLSVLETSEKTKRELIDNIETEINKIEASKLVESHKIFKDLSNKIRDVQQQMELKKVEVRSKLDKLEKLKEHKYDPKCKFCMDNIFVKDAIATKSKLEEDKKETDKLLATLNDLQKEIKKYEWVDGAYQKYTKLLNDKSNIKDEYDKVTKNIILTKNHLGKQLESHKLIVNQFESYHKNEISIQNNETVNSNISKLRMNLNSLTINIQKYNKVLMELSGKITLYESQIEKLKSTIEEVKKLEESYTLYELYLSSVGRDGIPHEVIYCTVPEIEREVNSILSQIVEFTISFENDGKNISPYIVYDSRSWAAEMSSGFERFVSSIAIRVALTNISNLPKSTFLVIDEGFGTLDGNNLPSMNSLFTFLKSNFDFILIISHLDSMKDMVDKTIEIKRDGNFSKVIYE